MLQRAGKRVALLDQGKMGNGVTGFTTAHLTEALDTRYFELRKTVGNDGARLVAQSHRAAIEHIARTVDEEKLDCSFRYLPGYLYSEESRDQIVQEHEAARACGIEVALLDRAPLPFPTKKALRFERQEVVVLALAGGLSVELPLERARELLRPVADSADMSRVQETLGSDQFPSNESWLRRRRDWVVLRL